MDYEPVVNIKNQERRDLKAAVIQINADLDFVIANIETATNTEMRQGLKKVTQAVKKLVNRVAQL